MDSSVTVKPHGHREIVENHVAKDKNINAAQGKTKVSSHSYSQLRPVRGDGGSRLVQLTSPTQKKPHDKDNESDNRGWENGTTSDDGGWSMGTPTRGSGWNGTGKVEGAGGGMASWQAAVKGSPAAVNSMQSALPRVTGDTNQTKEWPIASRNSGKSNSNTLGWMNNSEENINTSISDTNWGIPQDIEPVGSKHLDSEMTFELDPLRLEPGKVDAYYPDMNWTSEELEPNRNSAGNLTSPRHDELCFRRSPKVPQVGDIIATVDNRGVAETGYIPFGNPLKQVHSSDRRWTSKDSVSSTGSSASSSIQSPQRSSMSGGRMFQGKLGSVHSKLSTSNRGDKNSGNYNRTNIKPKNIGLFTAESGDKEPTGWGDLPSPNADLVDNGTSDWARPMARERQRMLIKSQLDGINGWDTGPVAHWEDKFDTGKNAGWAELSRQTGQQNNDDGEGWCTVNGKPSKNEAFHHQVQTLIEMGFKKEDCERVLKTNNCNLEHALGDLLALACTEEMSITTTNSELTKLQSVTTTTATSANLLAKSAMTSQLPVSTSSIVMPGTTSTTAGGGSVWTSKPTSSTAMPLSTANGSLSVSQALSSTAQALPLQQGQFNPQMFQPPVLPPKLLSEFSANSSSIGQQKQQLLSHLKLVNYHLAFLTKMQQTLFQKLSIFNDTSALMSGLPPPIVQQQKQEVLLQLQQVNTMIVIYSQQSVLLKQLSSSSGGNTNGSSGGSKTSPKVSKVGVNTNADPSNLDKEINESADQKHEQETEEKDKDVENVSTTENEPTLTKTIQSSNQVSVDETQKEVADKVPEEVIELQVEEKTVEEIPATTSSDIVATKEEIVQVSESSDTSLPSTATNTVASTTQPLTMAATLASVSTYDDDNFPPEFQPGKLWVPRSQATESSQPVSASKLNGIQPPSSTKSLSTVVPNSTKPVQAQLKASKFTPHFTIPQNSPAKVGIPSGITPMTQTPVRPGMPPPMGNKFTPSTRQIQNSINNLMFAQLGNNAAAAAAARKGTFPAPSIPGGFPRPGKKNLPMPQFPPPFMNSNNYGSFPSLPQPAMPPPPPQMGTAFPMKNPPYSPHNGMKKSSSFPGKPMGMIPPVMPPQQPSVYNYQPPGGANKANHPMPGGNGSFHGTLPANGNVIRQQMLWDTGKFGGPESLRPPIHQQQRPLPTGLSGAIDQQLTMPLSLGESLWSDNPNSPVSVTSPDPTFAEWQAGKKAHIFKLPSNSPSSWLVLRNLPPQIDHATLRDLCSGCGSVQTFYMSESMQNGLVRYSHPAEAAEAKIKLERANFNGISLMVDFASDSDIGEFIDSMSPRQEGSPPPLSFTAPATSDECWDDTFKPQAADSKWFSTTAPMNIPPSSDASSSSAPWKGGDLFAPWASQQNDAGEVNTVDNTNHLATSPSMATFLPNGLL